MIRPLHTVNCECGRPAALVELGSRFVWRCDICNAWVAANAVTYAPAGKLADAKARYWKTRALDSFNMLWKPVSANGIVRQERREVRSKAYKWLANEMQIDTSELHFDRLTLEQLQRIYAICSTTPTNFFGV